MWLIIFSGGKPHSESHSFTVSMSHFSSTVCMFPNFWFYHRSPDLLQSEEPFALSERRSSSDSNKVSSGELSPYDNNSPVLSERRGDPGSPAADQQFPAVEQVADWSREPSKGQLCRTYQVTKSFLSPVVLSNIF